MYYINSKKLLNPGKTKLAQQTKNAVHNIAMSGLGGSWDQEGTKIVQRIVDFYRNMVHTD